jgi:hypothetical protein
VSTLNFQPKNSNSETPARTASESARPASVPYVEVPALRHETRDVLKQLDANLNLIEDLTGRLSFVLGEVRQMIRR